jgi:hypothetical protein
MCDEAEKVTDGALAIRQAFSARLLACSPARDD